MDRHEPHDILLWEDGFWCFKEEFSEKFLRDDNYRFVLCNSDEWLTLISEKHKPASAANDKAE